MTDLQSERVDVLLFRSALFLLVTPPLGASAATADLLIFDDVRLRQSLYSADCLGILVGR